MREYTALGLIFANMHDEAVRDGTAVRSMGSLPFGGRYRLIDFVLSGMVNAGIGKVGVITKSYYQSLMDHLGSGKAWDLSRKNEGLYFLPPHSSDDAMYQGRIGSLCDVISFLQHSDDDLVVMSDCNMVASIDYAALIRRHVDSSADVTVAYRRGLFPPARPVYTKLRDCAPAQYGLHARVENSLVADGARIDGTVKNCVIFREVEVGRGAVLENCVVLQHTVVGAGCSLKCIIADKNVIFRDGRTLQGFDSYPVYIAKGSVV